MRSGCSSAAKSLASKIGNLSCITKHPSFASVCLDVEVFLFYGFSLASVINYIQTASHRLKDAAQIKPSGINSILDLSCSCSISSLLDLHIKVFQRDLMTRTYQQLLRVISLKT